MADLAWCEARACAIGLDKSFECGDGMPLLREQLSIAVFVLTREHDELIVRVAEQFGARERTGGAEASWPGASALGQGPLSDLVVAVLASVEARMHVIERALHRVDAHSRLIHRMHLASVKRGDVAGPARVGVALGR